MSIKSSVASETGKTFITHNKMPVVIYMSLLFFPSYAPQWVSDGLKERKLRRRKLAATGHMALLGDQLKMFLIYCAFLHFLPGFLYAVVCKGLNIPGGILLILYKWK